MHRRAVALALLLFAPVLAGCLGASQDLSEGEEPRELAPLTEPIHALGMFVSAKVPSFDGVGVHVDVQLPEGDGPFPVIVQYTPYSNNLNANGELWGFTREYAVGESLAGNALAEYYVPRGYGVAIAHVRGSGQSGGCFTTGGAEEAKDGYELVEWLGTQEWSNGKVALVGTSYVGTTPISTATLDPPHLATIVPVSAVTEWYRYYFENGEPRFFGELPTGFVYFDQPFWASLGFIPKPRNPVDSLPDAERAECAAAQLENAYAQDDYNAYWRERDYVKDIGNATTPMLYAHGFLDENTPTSLVPDFFNAYPGEKRMWLQQHGHGVPGDFEAYHEAVHRWLDHFLLGLDNGALDMPVVVLQDNRGQYHALPNWPLREGATRTYWLEGEALVPYGAAEGERSFVDDPRAFEETRGLVPESGTTHLLHRSEPLEDALHMSGAPRMHLRASSSATDTQWSALLYDEAPDGALTFVTRGYLDARHRESLERGVDVAPGTAEDYEWVLHGRDHHFEAGHRLVLVIKSSDVYIVPDAPGARNTVHSGPEASRLVLPVLDLEGVAFVDDPRALLPSS